MLKIKDIISILKELYNSNLIIENIFDVLITTGVFSLCCNFLSKVGLMFVAAAGVLYMLDVATGIVLLTLFTPSILFISNVPVVYTINIAKEIKRYKTMGSDENPINKEINEPVKKDKFDLNYNRDCSNYKSKNLVRVRKR